MIMAALIALSRLYLNVHYPTDVLVSLILGSIYGILAYVIIKAILNKSEKLKAIFINGESYKTIFTKK